MWNILTKVYCILSSCLPPNVGPPIFECHEQHPPLDQDKSFYSLGIGCDLCIEPGVTVDRLSIYCDPRTSGPTDCILATPNGTNVLDIIKRTGNTFRVADLRNTDVAISPVVSPDARPLGIDVFGTWTCVCNNSEGRVAAYTNLASCGEYSTIYYTLKFNYMVGWSIAIYGWGVIFTLVLCAEVIMLTEVHRM